MQNLENLKSRILEEANTKAQSILDEARTRAKAITNEAERKAFSETRQIEDETAALIEGKRRTAKVSMDLEERDSVLKAKRDRIDELVNSVPGAVKNIPSIECAPSGVVKVYTSRADADKITPTFLAEVSAQISQKGRSTTFSLMNESSDLDNGAVLKNDVVEVECSVNALLRSYREDLESIVATTLFDEGHDLEE